MAINRECANCGVTGVSLFACSNCKQTYYCSKICQTNDWKQDHKIACHQSADQSQNISVTNKRIGKKKKNFLDDKECDNCGAQGKCFSKCSRCKVACYCCQACQLQHWNAVGGHKKFCVSASVQMSFDPVAPIDSEIGIKCAICQDALLALNQTVLPCSHIFHSTCITSLRESGINQVCPLCRSSIDEDLEEMFENAKVNYAHREKVGHRCESTSDLLCTMQRKETDAAIIIFRRAANKGHASSQMFLGDIYFHGKGVKRSEIDAFHWYEKAAYQGLDKAQFNLAKMYDEGQGVKQNDAEAFNWYEKAANQGHDKAQFNLGLMYEEGKGVNQSETAAFCWFKKAAHNGLAKAQFILGNMHKTGQGVKQSNTEAFRWYDKAAHQGHTMAQFNLGVMYDEGQGVEISCDEAFHWYEKAAHQGLAKAQFNLGVMYDEGQGVKQSDALAFSWFEKAANQDHAMAQFLITDTNSTRRPLHLLIRIK